MASGKKNSRSNGSSKRTAARERWVVCLGNTGYAVSLEPRKIYRVLPDRKAERHQLVRIVDESGEDYLYPANLFAPIELSISTNRALRKVS